MAAHYLLAGKNQSSKLGLAELVGTLSLALDLTEGQPVGHCKRCCLMGVQLGQAISLDENEISDLYFALLLKDLGCSSNAARICQLYLSDDISFKRDFKKIDGSISSALRFVYQQTGLKVGFAERIGAIINIMQNGGEIARELIDTRCQRGAEIASKMHFNKAIQDSIKALDEHWDGNGKPLGLAGADIPLYSRIGLLVQVADVFHLDGGVASAIEEIKRRAGSWFEPRLVARFCDLAENAEFWEQQLDDQQLDDRLFAMQPAQKSQFVTDDHLDDIASAFADVIDAKSPFTAGHSARVTFYANLIAKEMGLTSVHRRELRRAALLHDIGKLAVSNEVLDKPDKLDDDEWTSIRSHPVHSGEILKNILAFSNLSAIARGHHERLDGRGYPDGLEGDEICLETRIVTTADVFDALSADRPYRKAMPLEQVLNIMSNDVGTAFDADCVEALKATVSRLDMATAA